MGAPLGESGACVAGLGGGQEMELEGGLSLGTRAVGDVEHESCAYVAFNGFRP